MDILIEFHQGIDNEESFQARIVQCDNFEEYIKKIKEGRVPDYKESTLMGNSISRRTQSVIIKETDKNIVYEFKPPLESFKKRCFIYKLSDNEKKGLEHMFN